MAQSGAAESNTLEKIIDELAAFEPVELPVVSLYLNAQANENGRQDFERFLRKEFTERARTFPANSPERESFDTAKLRTCITGGASMPVEVLRGFEDAFGAKRFLVSSLMCQQPWKGNATRSAA